MDRLDFSKSIDVDPRLQVKDFFDEVMAMYNLTEGINYKYIRGLVMDGAIQFAISFNTLDEAHHVAQYNDAKTIIVYNKNYNITCRIEECNKAVIMRLDQL